MLHVLPLIFITEVHNLAADVLTSIDVMPLMNKCLIAMQHHLYALYSKWALLLRPHPLASSVTIIRVLEIN